MAHTHEIIDSNPCFLINALTRTITPQQAAVQLIQGDHNSERFTFEVPRYIEGHDMCECSKVEVHYLNVSRDKQNKSADVYRVDDLKVSPDSDDVLTFSWLISGNATKYAGNLSFCIRFTCLTGETVDYAWHTEIYSGVSVGDGMNNGEAVLTEYSDIIAAWEKTIIEKLDFGAVIAQAEANAKKYTDAQTKVLEKRIGLLEGETLKYETVISPTGTTVPVPARSSSRAFIHEVGGYYARMSNNLLDPCLFGFDVDENGDIRYPGNAVGASATISLKAGTYTVYANADLRVSYLSEEAIEGTNNITFKLTENTDVTIDLAGDYYTWYEPFKIRVMLCRSAEADPFESYYKYEPAKVTGVRSFGAGTPEIVDAYNIPGDINKREDYGYGVPGYANLINFDTKKFIKKVEKIVFTGAEEGWSALSASAVPNNYFFIPIGALNTAIGGQILCNSYRTVTIASGNREKGIFLANSSSGEDRIIIRPHDAGTITLASFKARLAERYNSGNPVTAVYALAVPVETDISEHLTDYDSLLSLEVQPGGKLRFGPDTLDDSYSKVTFLCYNA